MAPIKKKKKKVKKFFFSLTGKTQTPFPDLGDLLGEGTGVVEPCIFPRPFGLHIQSGCYHKSTIDWMT